MAFQNSGEKQITPIQIQLQQERERAEKAERERDEVKEESKVLRRQRESYKKERGELREALKDVLRQVVPPSDDWWCPTCEESLSPARVTYQECCDECGTYLGYQNAKWIEKARRALGGE